MAIAKRAAVCGVGETDWSRDSGRSTLSLAVEAVKAALNDAALDLGSIDGIACFSENDSADPIDVASALGIRPDFQMHFLAGGSGAEQLIATAAAAVLAGLADT